MEITQERREIGEGFANALISKLNPRSSLLLAHSNFDLFKNLDCQHVDTFDYGQHFPSPEKWDLVVGDFPFGVHVDKRIFPEASTKLYSVAAAVKSLSFLAVDGLAIFSLEPSSVSLGAHSLRSHMVGTGFEVAAIINTPENYLKPFTALRSVFAIVRRTTSKFEFIGELEDAEQASQLAQNFCDGTVTSSLRGGISFGAGLFPGFNKWKIQQKVHLLDSEYKTFTSFKIRDIADEVNMCKSGEFFSGVSNSVYIPRIGAQPVIAQLNNAKLKHHNYFQVRCKPNLVSADYLAEFFNSELGRLILSSLTSESWIPNISKSEILDAQIALPALTVQQQIVSSIRKLLLIKEKISMFEGNLSLNPISSQHALDQIDSMLGVVGELAAEDRIKSVIMSGESKTVEFKESLSLDIKKQTKEKYIEDSAIKTIAAFLNTDGGVLLIGVDDSGNVNGVEKEIDMFHKNKDKLLLHFKNLIKTRIGEQFYPYIDQTLVLIGNKSVLCVECRQSSSEVYVDDKDFYVRTNPATDKLEGPKLVAYIKNHFSSGRH
ncbi:ATP-binding protein [Paraburkholderia hospita]|uniref:ATP-binding protein n=1 Tax=Paraburkholderia hospita TaxID=169430 RepID=UPI0009A89609|nr:RNA-binding domain-containing protein [Paraburkholderia hospita]SKC49403.1 Putative DNA-binding domain-containing protein [Paraburkholderia hospita]